MTLHRSCRTLPLLTLCPAPVCSFSCHFLGRKKHWLYCSWSNNKQKNRYCIVLNKSYRKAHVHSSCTHTVRAFVCMNMLLSAILPAFIRSYEWMLTPLTHKHMHLNISIAFHKMSVRSMRCTKIRNNNKKVYCVMAEHKLISLVQTKHKTECLFCGCCVFSSYFHSIFGWMLRNKMKRTK